MCWTETGFFFVFFFVSRNYCVHVVTAALIKVTRFTRPVTHSANVIQTNILPNSLNVFSSQQTIKHFEVHSTNDIAIWTSFNKQTTKQYDRFLKLTINIRVWNSSNKHNNNLNDIHTNKRCNNRNVIQSMKRHNLNFIQLCYIPVFI